MVLVVECLLPPVIEMETPALLLLLLLLLLVLPIPMLLPVPTQMTCLTLPLLSPLSTLTLVAMLLAPSVLVLYTPSSHVEFVVPPVPVMAPPVARHPRRTTHSVLS